MTIQITENLIFKGESMQMQVSACPTLLKDIPQIIDDDDGFAMSACWRGYVGTWEVKANKLFLVPLHGKYALKDESPIFAEWFTGTIVAPQGEIIHHPGTIGKCLHETDLRITIENGHVIRSETVDNLGRLKAQELSRENENCAVEYDIPTFLRRHAD